jgi:hypothetical protein
LLVLLAAVVWPLAQPAAAELDQATIEVRLVAQTGRIVGAADRRGARGSASTAHAPLSAGGA